MILFVSIIVIILVVIFGLLYRKNQINNRFCVINNKVYLDKTLFSERLTVKKPNCKVHFDFSEGDLTNISIYFNDRASVYLYAPDWDPCCYGSDRRLMDSRTFSSLYNFNLEKDAIVQMLTGTYLSLTPLC